MRKILVVEDDLDIQELLQNFLSEAGYEVSLSCDGIDGYTKFCNGQYDLVLLDILLPKVDGYGVCELIRKESQVPIIMLTALDSEENQIRGLDLQIDDYITKPFSMPILIRKIAAVLRRAEKTDVQNKYIHYKKLTLDLDGYKAYVENDTIELTQREFEVLRELLTHQGKVLTRQMLLNTIWQYDFYGDERVIDTHVKNLRKKLNIDFIETIRGVGYRVDKEN
jgi:two-component system response regulator VanR